MFGLFKKKEPAHSDEYRRADRQLDRQMSSIGVGSVRPYYEKTSAFVVSNLGPMMAHVGVLAPSPSRPLPTRSPTADIHQLGAAYILVAQACNLVFLESTAPEEQATEDVRTQRMDCIETAFNMLLGHEDHDFVESVEIQRFGTDLYAAVREDMLPAVHANYDAWSKLFWQNDTSTHHVIMQIYRDVLAYSRARQTA